MTSEDVGATLGDADADVRWLGLVRHRLLLVAAAIALSTIALVRRGSQPGQWMVITVLVALTAAGPGGRSWGELVVIEARFWLRRRLSWVHVAVEADDLIITAHGQHRVGTYDFTHRGRLDLSGYDATLAMGLSRMAQSMASAGGAAHVALHVEARGDDAVITSLSTTSPVVPPPQWRRDPHVGAPRTLRMGPNALIERRDYVRTRDHVLRTLRVAAMAPGREASALQALSDRVSWLTLSVHARVLPARRARRVTARAVHQVGSDAQLTSAAGFRWSAHRQWELEALRRRENAVAAGAALCQWAIYVVVVASTIEQLRDRVAEVTSAARAAGLRLEQGASRQREWFEFQLPGGPGW